MERGGTSTKTAFASERMLSIVPPVKSYSSRFQPKEISTFVRKTVLEDSVFDVVSPLSLFRIGMCTVLTYVSRVVRIVRIAAKALFQAKMQAVVFVAPNATTNLRAPSEQFVMRARDTKSSKCLLALKARSASMAQAAINGCWNIGGLCNRNWADRLAQRKTSTTSTANVTITDQKTWNFGNAHNLPVFEPLITIVRAVTALHSQKVNA